MNKPISEVVVCQIIALHKPNIGAQKNDESLEVRILSVQL